MNDALEVDPGDRSDPSHPLRPHGFENHVLTVIPPSVLDQVKSHPLLCPFYLTDVGYFPHAQNHYRKRAEGSEQHILIYCVRGTGFVEACGKRHQIVKNTVLLIPQGVAHAYGSLDEDDPWHIYWAHYQGSRAHHYNPGPMDDVFVAPVPNIKYAQISRIFHSIFNLLDRGMTLANLIHAAHTLAYVLSEMFFASRPADAAKQRRAIDYVENSITHMQEHIHENLTLGDLADRCNISKGHLTQLFKAQVGCSPIRYFINLKMQQAYRYLDLTDMSVKEVAATMGYSDPYYFSRLFTQTIGMSPSEYRAIAKG